MPGTLEEPLGQSKWAKRVQEMRPDARGRRGAAFGKQVLLFRMKQGDIAGLGTEGCGELGRGIKRSLCGERKGEGTRVEARRRVGRTVAAIRGRDDGDLGRMVAVAVVRNV